MVRNSARRVLVILVVAGCGCAAPARDHAAPRRLEPVVDAAAFREVANPGAEIQDLVARINRHRRAIGCPTLRWDDRLAAVALRHSQDMARRRFFSHTNPDGRDPFDRLRRARVRYRAAAENLAAGQITGAETFDGWMGSPGHRRNLEDCDYTRIGIGLHRGRWTCLLSLPPG
jgi:uncharacterized protein YkwD